MTQSITIKLSNGTQHVIQLPTGDEPNCSLSTITVNQLKTLAAEVINIPPEQQRMVYRGKILKGNGNDDVLLSQFGVEDGHTIHVVKGQAPSSATAPPSQTTGNNNANTPTTNTASGVSSTPIPVQPSTTSTPQQVNPFAAIFSGANSVPVQNPSFTPPYQMPGQGFGAWPPMGMDPATTSAMLNNPMMMQAAQQMMQRNPQLMQQIMAYNPMTANLPPAEREMLTTLMQNPQMMEQMMSIVANAQGSPGHAMNTPTGGGGVNPYAAMLGSGGGGLGSAYGGGGGMHPSPMVPTPDMSAVRNPRDLYATQLEQLRVMGFPNEGANIAALQMSNGSIEFAIERLLNSGSGF